MAVSRLYFIRHPLSGPERGPPGSSRPGNPRPGESGPRFPIPGRIGKRGISRFPISAESGIGDSLPDSRPNRESGERELGISGSGELTGRQRSGCCHWPQHLCSCLPASGRCHCQVRTLRLGVGPQAESESVPAGCIMIHGPPAARPPPGVRAGALSEQGRADSDGLGGGGPPGGGGRPAAGPIFWQARSSSESHDGTCHWQ